MTLSGWPTITDDTGTKVNGTRLNKALFDAIKESIEDSLAGELVNVTAFTTTNIITGVNDARQAFIDAAASILASGGKGTLYLPPGDYLLSKYIYLTGFTGLTVWGPGATIHYQSSDTSLVADAFAVSNAQARSAFVLNDSPDTTFREITFEGDDVETDITVNIGVGIIVRNSEDVKVLNCKGRYGASLYQQDNFASDVGARILGNTVYGARGNMTCGSYAVIAQNRFELPTDVGYDRSGNDGSSHAVYLFAGRTDVVIEGNVFQNMRKYGVKISGSSLPIRNMAIRGNTFNDCGGGIQWGADDTQEHSNAIIEGNLFYNCATNRSGWNEGNVVQALGNKSVLIRGNGFHWNRDCDASVTASAVIAVQVTRYTSTSSPVENVIIESNQFYGDVRTGFATGNANILGILMDVREAGAGSDFFAGQARAYGTLVIRGNVVKSISSTMIQAVRCVGLIVDSNEVANVAVMAALTGCRLPRITNNVTIAGPSTTSNAYIKMTRCSFPIIGGNSSSDRGNGSTAGKGTTIGDNDGGTTPVDFPLLGFTGRHRPNAALQEVVMAYGDGWADGDTVVIDGNTFTYKGTAPGAGEFNTMATLVALIDALANYTCVDYGAAYSVVTNHLMIRRSAANATADLYNVAVTAVHPCAGVLLTNGGATVGACYSRGGEAAGPGTFLIIWSPLAFMWSNPSLFPDNAAAVTLLTATAPPWVTTATRVDRHSGSNLVVTIPAIAGTEQFRWSLQG